MAKTKTRRARQRKRARPPLTDDDYAPAIMHAFGFTYLKTGEVAYRDAVLKRLPRLGRARKMWGATQSFGNQLRNTPYALWYLSEALCRKVKE